MIAGFIQSVCNIQVHLEVSLVVMLVIDGTTVCCCNQFKQLKAA